MSWNFALVLFILLIVTGIVWTYDFFVARRARAARVQRPCGACAARVRHAGGTFVACVRLMC